jgi:TPR repeat protein
METSNSQDENVVVLKATYPHELLVSLNRLCGGEKSPLLDEEKLVRQFETKYPDKKNELILLKLAYEQNLVDEFFENDTQKDWMKRVFLEKSLHTLVRMTQEKYAVVILETFMFLFQWKFSLKVPRKWKAPKEEQAHFHETTYAKQLRGRKQWENVQLDINRSVPKRRHFKGHVIESGEEMPKLEPVETENPVRGKAPAAGNVQASEPESAKTQTQNGQRAANQKKDARPAATPIRNEIPLVLQQKPEQVKFYRTMNAKKKVSLTRALRGDIRSQCEMGDYYADRSSNHVDYKEAIRWYEVSAEKGYERAMFEMGKLYDMNLPEVNQTRDKAIRIYSKLAEQGYPTAQCILGIKYRFGDGVKEDTRAAKEWLTKAAMQRHEGAIRNLADLCMSLHDVAGAQKWYQIGAANGDDYCRRKLDLGKGNKKP